MMAVSVVAVVIATVAATTFRLPGTAAAPSKVKVCLSDKNAAAAACDVDVLAGESFGIDCTNTTQVVPTELLATEIAKVEVCPGAVKAGDTGCPGGVSAVQLEGYSKVSVIKVSATGWMAGYTGHEGATDVVLGGLCIAAGGEGMFFTFTLKATTSTHTPTNSATSSFGLAIASSLALLGFLLAAV